MAKTYYTVLTTYGAQLFAQAMANRQQVRITQFAVGDGNGRAVQPDSARTSLVREVHRANISAVSPDPRNNKQVIFELTIPENVGGFWIREMGIYDNNNRLVAYANCPDTYKPQLSEGSGKVQVIRMILLVSSSNAVTLSVDDSVIFVTRGQLTPKTITATSQNGVDETGHSHAIEQASTTRKGITQLTNDTGLDSETLALTAKAGKALAQRIAQNQQGIAGLNSGKVDKTAISNSVNSTSQTNVASSQAVKTAYDKGVEAKNAADAAQRTANDGVNKANNANTNANGRVSKSGDTMTGILEIDRADSFVRGKRNGVNKWYVGTPNGSTDDIVLHNYNYGYGIVLKSDRVETSKPFYVGANRVPHAGDSYMDLTSSNYGGITIHRPDRNDKMMFESNGDGFAFIRRNRTTNQNHYVVSMPARSGALLLDNDLTGAIMYFAMSSAPTGWLKANGAAVSRTTYAALFAKIGTTFGAGDGRTTFNLPDLRGEFIRGWDDGRNVDSGRHFGSGQLASAQPLSSNGSQFVMGLANKDNNPNHIWSRSQHDKIAKGTLGYQDVKVSYTSIFDWHGRNQHGFVNNSNNGVEFGAMRPRNVALLACIKY